jgi:hypothetical protein
MVKKNRLMTCKMVVSWRICWLNFRTTFMSNVLQEQIAKSPAIVMILRRQRKDHSSRMDYAKNIYIYIVYIKLLYLYTSLLKPLSRIYLEISPLQVKGCRILAYASCSAYGVWARWYPYSAIQALGPWFEPECRQALETRDFMLSCSDVKLGWWIRERTCTCSLKIYLL